MQITIEAKSDDGELVDEKDLDPEEVRIIERALGDLGETLNDALDDLDEDEVGYDECSRELDIQFHTQDKISAFWSAVSGYMEVY